MHLRSQLLRILAVLAASPLLSGNWTGRAVPMVGAPGLRCPVPVGDWVGTSVQGVPDPTRPRLAAWTGSRLLVVNQHGEGGLFDVCANRWSHVSTEGVPQQLALYGDRSRAVQKRPARRAPRWTVKRNVSVFTCSKRRVPPEGGKS